VWWLRRWGLPLSPPLPPLLLSLPRGGAGEEGERGDVGGEHVEEEVRVFRGGVHGGRLQGGHYGCEGQRSRTGGASSRRRRRRRRRAWGAGCAMEAVGRVRVGAGADAVAVRINGKRRVSLIRRQADVVASRTAATCMF